MFEQMKAELKALEELRREMLEAFRDWRASEPGRRDAEWFYYTKLREDYLRATAKANHKFYEPLEVIPMRTQ